MDYLEFFEALNQAGIRYLVAGGVAVNLYGIPRMTYDVDLAVAFDESNLSSLLKFLDKKGYKPRVPVDLLDLKSPTFRKKLMNEKNMLALNFRRTVPPLGEVDIILALPQPFEVLESRKKTVKAGMVNIPLVSLDDLLSMKEGSGRAQDAADVKLLRRLGERKSDD